MKKRFEHPGFEKIRLEVLSAGLFSVAKILVNDIPAEGKKGVFVVNDDSGAPKTIKLKSSMFDPLPKILMDGSEYLLDRPLRWYEHAWAGSPFLLVFVGGFFGALIGFSAAYTGTRIFRSDRAPALKYVLVALNSVGAFILFFVIAVILQVVVENYT